MNCLYCGAVVPAGAQNCPACGSPVQEGGLSQTLPSGTTLQGKYRLESVLGQGGFGITYAATQVHLGTKLAIKELFPSGSVRLAGRVHPPSTFSGAQWQQAQADFTAEARTLGRFSHPDIVSVQDLFEENGTAYMVMERLTGESLGEKLERVGVLPPAEVEAVAVRVLQALNVVHGAGLLHRDIKPDNIYLEASGRVVLVDFGSARTFISGQTVQHTRLVTPGYAPMEQYGSAARFGPYTDIYALGASLYHALSGYPPPPAPELLMGTPLPPLPAGTPVGLRNAVQQSMSVKVADRPQDAASVLSLLQGTLQPPVRVGTLPATPENIAQAWQAITAIPAPTARTLPDPTKQPVNSPALQQRRVLAALRTGLLALAAFALPSLGAGWLMTLLFVGLAVWSWQGVTHPGKPAVMAKLNRLDNEIRALHHDFMRRGAGAGDFEAARSGLNQLRQQLTGAPNLLAQRQQEASMQFSQQAIAQELRGRVLSAGLVEGIGEKRVQLLRQHGISTAADIEKRRLSRVPGVGTKKTQALLTWRQAQETEIRRQLPAPPQNVTQAAEMQVNTELMTLLEELRRGPARLQAAIHADETDYQQTKAQLDALIKQREELLKQL